MVGIENVCRWKSLIGLGKFSKLGDNKDTGRGYHRRADHSSRYRVIPPGPWHPDTGRGCCHSSILAQTWREVNNMSANTTYTNIARLVTVSVSGELLICHLSLSDVRGQMYRRAQLSQTNKQSLNNKEN